MVVSDFKPDIFIGVPLYAQMENTDFSACLEDAIATTIKAGYKVSRGKKSSSLISKNRIDICREALKLGASYIVMFDSDTLFPPDTIVRMLSHKKDIVSGLYFYKRPPFAPLMFKRHETDSYSSITDWKRGSLISVDSVGTGCILIKADVLRKIPKPWFSIPPKFLEYTLDGGFAINHDRIKNTGLDDNDCLGEDTWFCYLARQCGYEIWVDTSLELKHLGDYPFGIEEYLYYQEESKCEQKQS